MGCANYHVRVRFDDGSRSWLLRVPRATSFVGCPEPVVDYLVVSEYATLKFLEQTAVPAPRAFGYGIRSDGSDHGIGVSFLLVKELSGKPWSHGDLPVSESTKHERARICSGLADILAELARHPFPKAGSLRLEGSRIQVGPTASDRFVVLDPDGPFVSAVDYYTAWAEKYLELIADRQLYSEYPVDAYLVYRFLRVNAGQLAEAEDDGSGGFFLKHADDHGDHILLDDDFNITGVIDWQMARVAPGGEAFGPSLVTVDMRKLCAEGNVSLSADDVRLTTALRGRGHTELAGWMGDENERARRFFWGLGLEPRWSNALPLATALLRAFGVQQDWAEWRESAMLEYWPDKRLRALVRTCPPKRPRLRRQCKNAANSQV
jgi:hypothetical protein